MHGKYLFEGDLNNAKELGTTTVLVPFLPLPYAGNGILH